MDQTPILIRDATAGDRAFVTTVAARLAAFEPPPWRQVAEIVSAEVRTLEAFFAAPRPDASLFVATLDGEPAGFAFLETMRDYFTGERHGHIGMIAVAEASQNRGVAGALMRAAERWARDRGYRRLTLHVFDTNTRARGLYDHLGYRPETLRLVKML